ncbi:MAG TPA: NADH-quinone oxidoreductase subunit I [Symbiobacteriaceae bacterium]|nr:NADH-quinone oxidoreductase subunit I [Symbiobacteriaceae bacterium]
MGATNFFGEAWKAGKSIAIGLNITFKEMWTRPPITVFYPDVLDDVPAWFRGIPLQKTDLLTGEYKCTSCGMCVEACPVNVITLEWHQDPATKKKVIDRYAIDMSRCMLCNYCIESCPFDSLVMGYDYELCKVDPENMLYEMEDLLRLGLKYSKAEQPGPAAKKKATPPWVFHELTGATEDDIQDKNGFLGRAPLGKGYVPDLKDQFKKPAEETAQNAAHEAKAPAAPATTKNTPTQSAPVNANPANVSAEAGPVKPAVAKATEAGAKEATEVRPDQTVNTETGTKDGEEAK